MGIIPAVKGRPVNTNGKPVVVFGPAGQLNLDHPGHAVASVADGYPLIGQGLTGGDHPFRGTRVASQPHESLIIPHHTVKTGIALHGEPRSWWLLAVILHPKPVNGNREIPWQRVEALHLVKVEALSSGDVDNPFYPGQGRIGAR